MNVNTLKDINMFFFSQKGQSWEIRDDNSFFDGSMRATPLCRKYIVWHTCAFMFAERYVCRAISPSTQRGLLLEGAQVRQMFAQVLAQKIKKKQP